MEGPRLRPTAGAFARGSTNVATVPPKHLVTMQSRGTTLNACPSRHVPWETPVSSSRLTAARILFTGAALAATLPSAAAVLSVDLSTYGRIGRYDLPEPTRTTAPANSLLAQEVSAVTYNRDTDSLFVLGDGGTSIVQVSKTGALIDSMTLPLDASKPQGTFVYDPEGLTYVGGGQFALVEERFRQVSLFTYAGNTTLDPSTLRTVVLGTTVGNTGLEGISLDPLTGGYVLVKEKTPQGVFQTTLDFAAGTASNGSAATVNSSNLFDPAPLGLVDIADVYALSGLPSLAGRADEANLLLLSQESGRVVEVDRSGIVQSSLAIIRDADTLLPVLEQGFEGITMDDDGLLYLVAEAAGGNSNRPQLWVYQAGAPQQVDPDAGGGGGGGSGGAQVRITEWMYNAPSGGGEFVEFTNVGPEAVDFTGWSYDDDSRIPGVFSLTGFGVVDAGMSVVMTESTCDSFRSSWALPSATKLLCEYTNNLGRADEINLFDADGTLVDRLAYGDNDPTRGGPRTQNTSGRPTSLAALGANDPTLWVLSSVGDVEGSYRSSRGEVGSPGRTSFRSVPTPATLPLLGIALLGAGALRRTLRAGRGVS